jgi:DNA-binding PadR family transcriptional regulator
MKPAASTLEHAILGLLSRQPQSGYDLRKAFAARLRYYSDSPGSIYPALRRLESRGWIAPVAEGADNRSRQPFELTPAGKQGLMAWLEQPLTAEDISLRLAELMLRFSLMDGNVPRSITLNFLSTLGEALAARAAELRRHYEELCAKFPVSTGLLSMLSGAETMEAQARWTRVASATLEGKTA